MTCYRLCGTFAHVRLTKLCCIFSSDAFTLHRYVPVGMLEVVPQQMNQRPPNNLCGRSDLETRFLSKNCADWIKISEMLLGKVPEGFEFEPKHKANSYKS